MADDEQKTEQAGPEQPPEPEVVGLMRAEFSEAVLAADDFRGQPSVLLDTAALVRVCRWLRDRQGFGYLADVVAVDYPGRPKRFEVVYQLYCHERAERLRLRVQVAEDEALPSVTGVWSGAEWPERECFDLMGVSFSDHPDLRRILLPEEASGHPLRKDYPLRGRKDSDDDLGYRVARS